MNDLELLISRLGQWQRWTKLQKAVYYSARGLVFGILVFAIIAIFLIPTDALLPSTYFILLTASGLLGLVTAAGFAWLWPYPPLKLARNYDQVFDLKERVSAAIELSQHDQVDQSWQELQLADALEETRTIIPKNGLKWHIPKLEIGILFLASIVILGSWFWGQLSFHQAEINVKNQQLIENEAKNVEKLISDVKNNDQLSDETKDAISSPLQDSLDSLKQANSPEEAVSALSDAQQTLEELGNSSSDEFKGLQAAGKELAKNQDSPLSLAGQALSQGNLQAAAEQLAALDLSKLNPQALAMLAQQLSESAQQLEGSSPELAKQLQQAADALKANDLQAAQEAIANASDALANSIQRAETSNAARKAAGALADSQGRLLAAAMFGSSAQSGGMQTNSNESPKTEQKGSYGSQASSGGFEESKSPGTEVGLTPVSQSNEPGNSSEKQYDSIYAPQRLGGTSDTELSLGTGDNTASNAIGGISSSFEQNAQSFVPYSEVYSNYNGTVQQALENGSIPLSLQPLVRDYFSSLDPR